TDGDGSHGSTSKTPSYTKSVSWHHYLLGILSLFVGALIGVNILGIAVAAYVAVNTNKWFYEKEVKGLNTWSL
ncbi:hypothetical protein RNQ76_23520, partial [Escherichia coli]|nr:hypothetical protein [Escherichia coli]